VVVDDQDAVGHGSLIGSSAAADKRDVDTRSETYRSWIVGELVLVALLGSSTAFLALSSTLEGYQLPEARLTLDTAVAVFATIVAILAAVRFRVEGRLMDLFVTAAFFASGLATFGYRVAPLLAGRELGPEEAWAAICVELVAAALLAAAPFVHRRLAARRQALAAVAVAVVLLLPGVWLAVHVVGAAGPLEGPTGTRTAASTAAFGLLALLALVALVGFGLRFRRYGRDLDSWFALALTLIVFADLHYLLTPVLSSGYVLQGDFLRLLSYGVLLVGVWRAISEAEFGRAVAEERARIAREIHDGLAQYLFAISTSVSMLETGAALDDILPRLKKASVAAQQEARFAVLALSSAGGSAPFDAALRRYVEFLTADGALDVEVEIDPSVRLDADEQIEIFRIVQEGLANARKHAGARQAEVLIAQRAGRRVVVVRDDGSGFAADEEPVGQGLRNMRLRAASIEGGFSLRSQPGIGTAIEVVLRT
jgi:signal transduction histidine kinase